MLKAICFQSFYENICVTYCSLIPIVIVVKRLEDTKPRALYPFIHSDVWNVKENWLVSQGKFCLSYQLLLLFLASERMNGYKSFVFISSSFFATKTTLRCVRQYTEKKADEEYEREDRVVPVVWKRSWRSVLSFYNTLDFLNKDCQSGLQYILVSIGY